MPGRADSYLVRCQSVSSRPGSLRWMFLEVLSKRVFFSFRGMVFRMIIMYQGGKCDGRYDVEIPSQRTDCRFDLQPCDGNSYFLPHQVDGEWDDSIRTWKIISVQCQSAKLSTVNTDGTTPSVKLPPQFCLSRDIMQHARLRTQKSRCLQPPLSFHLKVCAWTSVLKPTLGLTLTPLTRMNFDMRRFLSQKLHVYYIWQWQDISNMNTSLNLVCFKQRGGWCRVSNSCISFAGYSALISLINSQKACPIEQVEIGFNLHILLSTSPPGDDTIWDAVALLKWLIPHVLKIKLSICLAGAFDCFCLRYFARQTFGIMSKSAGISCSNYIVINVRYHLLFHPEYPRYLIPGN